MVVATPLDSRKSRVYRHWTPAFCVGDPDQTRCSGIPAVLELIPKTGAHRLLPAPVRRRLRAVLLPRE
jgi:hypothetical protein